MKKNISVLLPSIRPKNLIKCFSALENACKKYSFELIIVSPYLPPEKILTNSKIKFLHTYSSPTVALQKACLLAEGEFIFNTADDGLLQENCLDEAYELFHQNCTDKDLINMTYVEAVLNDETLEIISDEVFKKQIETMSSEYWFAHTHADLACLAGIEKEWKISLNFFMRLDQFKNLGGFDCQFEFTNHASHDLCFRIQANGGQVHNSKKPVYFCSHLPGTIKDHAPVHYAQITSDAIKFSNIYQNKNITFKRINIDYDNWKNESDIWQRRFPSKLHLTPN